MKVTKKEAFELYQEAAASDDSLKSKESKFKAAAEKFLKDYNLENEEMDKVRRKFSRLHESKPKNTQSLMVAKWESSIFYENASKKGRKSKSLGQNPCTKTQREILSGIVANIEDFAANQGVSLFDALDKIVEECKRKWKVKDVTHKACLPDVAVVALVHNVGLSLAQYQMIRTICLPYMNFPTKNIVCALKSRYHPKITSLAIKSSVNMQELHEDALHGLLDVLGTVPGNDDCFNLIGKFGLDGSGGHKIRHQLANSAAVAVETPHLEQKKINSFLLLCYCPLELKKSYETIWENPVPNSTSFARPVSLSKAKEEGSCCRGDIQCHSLHQQWG